MNLRQLRNISRTLMHACGLARSATTIPYRELPGPRMRRGGTIFRQGLALLALLGCMTASQAETNATTGQHATSPAAMTSVVPILVYHRFVPTAADRPAPGAASEYLARRMTMGIETLAAQLKYLREAGYTIVPLRQVVEAFGGRGAALPAKAVAITVDDGHRSVYSELLPLVEREKIPVTVFVYPSAISNADWAMTWQQLARLRESGLFDIQSHTYWHPDFRLEKSRLEPAAYQSFVRNQLEKSRREIRQRLSTPGAPVAADMLAWTFGAHDEELLAAARDAGYVAAFTTDERAARGSDNLLALPRYLMFEAYGVERFARLLADGAK